MGIIEQGSLLATGTVDEIRQSFHAARQIVVKVVGEHDRAIYVLREIDEVSDIAMVGDEIRFAIFSFGAAITVLNLALVFRALRYRRIAVPR